jgi:twitching motility two-component system response regulator PilG
MLKVRPIAQVPGFTRKFSSSRALRNAYAGRSRGSPMENLATTSSARLAGLKVLVIDDSKTIRRTAETLLAKEGCEVFTAVDGFDALSKIADHQPDIVFVDIMMPRLDGYQTCSLIKHNKVFRSIPVIMLSSKDGLFDRARGRIVGSEHYLTKPFTKDELLNAIETHVGQPAR